MQPQQKAVYTREFQKQNACPHCGSVFFTPSNNGDVTIDGLTVLWQDQRTQLTMREMKVFRVLFDKYPQRVTREHIFKTVWDTTTVEPKALDVYMSKIRTKLRRATIPFGIESVWGVGYRLVAKK